MAKRQKDVCPGCSKHCPLEHVRCKYGRRYIEKMQLAADNHRCKWEKWVTQGSLAWHFLHVGSQSKKALRKQRLTEQEWLSVLDEAEQAQLSALLKKLSGILG